MKKKKTALSKGKKRACIMIGGISFAAAVLCGVCFLHPKTVSAEQTDYSCHMEAGVSYRVKIFPNALYEGEWMEEGRLYSSALTDYIEVKFQASTTGSGPAAVSGDYTVTGVLEGYQEAKDSKKTIYEQKFPLKSGTVSDNGSGNGSIEDTLKIRRSVYQQAVDQAESILGTPTSKQFYLLFEGDFLSETEYGSLEKPFSVSLAIPVDKNSSLFEISKPDLWTDEGTITSNVQVTEKPGTIPAVFTALWAVISVAFLLWAALGTRLPDEEEKYTAYLKTVMRKYGSRLIRMERLYIPEPETCLEVSGINELIMISEELHRPVCYCADENGLPEAGFLYIKEAENCYLLRLKKSSSPSGAEKGDKGGRDTDQKIPEEERKE